ncbi:MAG: hypothetical protein WC895_02930 [Candidatus Shapirobacteria bacterium]|jgi:hypothetical protein
MPHTDTEIVELDPSALEELNKDDDYVSFMPRKVTLPTVPPEATVDLYKALKDIENAADEMQDAVQRGLPGNKNRQINDLAEDAQQIYIELNRVIHQEFDRAASRTAEEIGHMTKVAKIVAQLIRKGHVKEARELLGTRTAYEQLPAFNKSKLVNPKHTKPFGPFKDEVSQEQAETFYKELLTYPQPIFVKGNNGLRYDCDVSYDPLKWVASDGSVLHLNYLSDLVDYTVDWWLGAMAAVGDGMQPIDEFEIYKYERIEDRRDVKDMIREAAKLIREGKIEEAKKLLAESEVKPVELPKPKVVEPPDATKAKNKWAELAKRLIAKGHLAEAREVLALDWSAEEEYKRIQQMEKDTFGPGGSAWEKPPTGTPEEVAEGNAVQACIDKIKSACMEMEREIERIYGHQHRDVTDLFDELEALVLEWR